VIERRLRTGGRLAFSEFVRQLTPMILICALVSVSGGCTSNEALPAIQPIAHERALEVQDLIGCYELLSVAWSPLFSEEGRRFYAPPRYFALTSDVLGIRRLGESNRVSPTTTSEWEFGESTTKMRSRQSLRTDGSV
jgi:hypothetical protein